MPWMREIRIERALDLLDRLQQLAEALEGEELALQRHQDRMRGRHGVDGQEVQRRRAVDQDIGIVSVATRLLVAACGESLPKPESAVGLLRDLELDTEKVERRRGDRHPRHGRRNGGLGERRLADQEIVGRAAPALAVDAEAGRGVALRIEIDDQDLLADRRKRRPEIDRRRCLADAALLVGEGDHPR